MRSAPGVVLALALSLSNQTSTQSLQLTERSPANGSESLESSVEEAVVVVATVGGRPITTLQVRERYRALAPFQQLRLGGTWSEQRMAVLNELLAPEERFRLSLSQKDAPLGGRLRDIETQALARVLRAQLGRKEKSRPVRVAEVDEFYQKQSRFYQRPRAHLLWRILVGTHRKAATLLSELSSGSGRSWRRMARMESLDEATNMRSGSLGFVAKNGHTHRPQVRVDPGLFAAANGLQEAGVVPQPVAEGNYFAVVWRRATREARSVDRVNAGNAIRLLILQQRHHRAIEELLQRLRAEYLTDYHPESIVQLESSFLESLGSYKNSENSKGQRTAEMVSDKQPQAAELPGKLPVVLPVKTETGLR